jgi:hypothetical protein
MQIGSRTNRTYWATPVLGLVLGLAFLIASLAGGHPALGVFSLVWLGGWSVAIAIIGLRSETVRGLLDNRDERLAGISLRATALCGGAMIGAVIIGTVVSLARGQSGSPYDIIGAVGGVTYLAAVAYYRIRG